VSAGPEQFGYLSDAVSAISDLQVQNHILLRQLQSKNKVKNCRDYEEAEGRMNTDMLHRLVIIGGPQLPASDDLQQHLRTQVASADFSLSKT
jgi:hypothetical protein